MNYIYNLYQSNSIYILSNQLLDYLAVDKKPMLYIDRKWTKLSKKEIKALEAISLIKNKVCRFYKIPEENIALQVQETSTCASNGTYSQGVIGISKQILKQYSHIDYSKENPTGNHIRRKPFWDFLKNLPENPNELYLSLTSLNKEDLSYYTSLSNDFYLNFSDVEFEFILSHEIGGHIQNNDSLKNLVLSFTSFFGSHVLKAHLSSLFGVNPMFCQMTTSMLTNLFVYKIIWPHVEQKADLAALKSDRLRTGGLLCLKRLFVQEFFTRQRALAVNETNPNETLNSYLPQTHTSCHFSLFSRMNTYWNSKEFSH